MTARNDIDRSLSAWLNDTAVTREPEHLLGQVLARTARTRRRPAWRIPERWISVSTITSRLSPASPIPWRTIAVAALLLVALAVSLALIAGAPKPLAPPFGLASNGSLLFSVNGDIVTADTPTGQSRVVIGGATTDRYPVFAPDGSRFHFFRGPDTALELWVANADGSGLLKIAGRFAQMPQWAEWSPSGDVVALTGLGGDDGVITLVRADGTGSTRIETGLRTADSPIFRPTLGDALLFRGEAANLDWGYYLVNRDGSGLKPLDLDAGFAQDEFYDINKSYYFQGASWNAAGTTLSYFTLEPSPGNDPGFRIHVADVGASGVVTSDRIVEFDAATDDEWDVVSIPGSNQVVFESIEGPRHVLMLGSTAPGAGPPTSLDVVAQDDIGVLLSPDGKQIVAVIPGAGDTAPQLVLVDLASGNKTEIVLGDDVVWQRRAP
ncbi:MAG: hypothetical protein ABIZ52_02310 [Candidatus Limnocylindrales bacterium]